MYHILNGPTKGPLDYEQKKSIQSTVEGTMKHLEINLYNMIHIMCIFRIDLAV